MNNMYAFICVIIAVGQIKADSSSPLLSPHVNNGSQRTVESVKDNAKPWWIIAKSQNKAPVPILSIIHREKRLDQSVLGKEPAITRVIFCEFCRSNAGDLVFDGFWQRLMQLIREGGDVRWNTLDDPSKLTLDTMQDAQSDLNNNRVRAEVLHLFQKIGNKCKGYSECPQHMGIVTSQADPRNTILSRRGDVPGDHHWLKNFLTILPQFSCKAILDLPLLERNDHLILVVGITPKELGEHVAASFKVRRRYFSWSLSRLITTGSPYYRGKHEEMGNLVQKQGVENNFIKACEEADKLNGNIELACISAI